MGKLQNVCNHINVDYNYNVFTLQTIVNHLQFDGENYRMFVITSMLITIIMYSHYKYTILVVFRLQLLL